MIFESELDKGVDEIGDFEGIEGRRLYGLYEATVADDRDFKKTGKIYVEIELLSGDSVYEDTGDNKIKFNSSQDRINKNLSEAIKEPQNFYFDVEISTLGGNSIDSGMYLLPPIKTKGYVMFINGDREKGVWVGSKVGFEGIENSTYSPRMIGPNDSIKKTTKNENASGIKPNRNSEISSLNNQRAFIYKQKYPNINQNNESIDAMNTVIMNKEMFYFGHNFKSEIIGNDDGIVVNVMKSSEEEEVEISYNITNNGVKIISNNGTMSFVNDLQDDETKLVRYKEFKEFADSMLEHKHLAQGQTTSAMDMSNVTLKALLQKTVKNAKSNKYGESV